MQEQPPPQYVIVCAGTFLDGKGSAAFQIYELGEGGAYYASNAQMNDPVPYRSAVLRLEQFNARHMATAPPGA